MTPSSRRVLAVLGLVLSMAGLAAVIEPTLLSAPAHDTFLSLVGIVLAALGVGGLVPGRFEPVDYAEVPEVESRSTATVPGDGFDRALADRSPDVRDRLREIVVGTLTTLTDCTEAEARDLLSEGTWTDDPVAAAFFSPTVDPGADRRTVGDRVRASIGFEGGNVLDQVRRAVGALTALASVETPEAIAGPDPVERTDRRVTDGQPSLRADGALPSSDGPGLPSRGESVDRQTHRWQGIGSLALLAAGVGVIVREPALLLVAAVGGWLAAYDAYGRIGTPPDPDLTVRRTVDDPEPQVGDSVSVSVTIANEGDEHLRDLRYVDGVPPALEVVGGTSRTATTLAPGAEATLSYTLRAEHGRHEFESGLAVVRGTSAVTERTVAIEGNGPSIVCRLTATRPTSGGIDLRSQTSDQFGTIPTDAGGEGIEFYGTREYRRGDPASQIDWRRFARTGDLSVVQFRQERTATVVLVIDARAAAYLAPRPSDRSAVGRGVDAVSAVLSGLLDDGHRVGVTALTPREALWVTPGSGRDHWLRVRETLATHPSLSPTPPVEPFYPWVAEAIVRSRLPRDAQVVLFSPLCDDYSAEFARLLEAHGHATTVVSPDPTAASSTGRALARVERAVRIAGLRATGIPVYDWGRDESLVRTFARSTAGGGARG